MNRLRIVGVSIVVMFLGGSFSFDSVYGQLDECFGGGCSCFDTPAGKLCAYDDPFSTGFILLLIVIGIGTFFLFYFLLRTKKSKHKT